MLKSPADCFSAKLRLCAAEGSDKVEEEAPAGCPCLEVNESCCSVVMTQKTTNVTGGKWIRKAAFNHVLIETGQGNH